MARIVVAADDYGLAPGVDAAIRELVAAGVVTATSCMTTFPEWPDAGARLGPLSHRADLGVHLTLTDHPPLGPMPTLAPEGRLPPFPALLRRAHARQLDLAEVHAELSRQVDRFEAVLGRPPDHLDGHHHVQQLPGIRDVVVALARERLAPGGWVRTCAERPAAALARGVGLGRALAFGAAGRGLAVRLRRAGVGTNDGLTGLYGFDLEPAWATLLPAFLRQVRDRTVLVCHPGWPDDVLRSRDGLVAPRAAEAAGLRDALPGLLDALGARAVRFRDAL